MPAVGAGPMLFQTPRLLVRRMVTGDLGDLLAVYGDADAMRYVDDGGVLTRSEAERWLEVTRANESRRGYGMSAVEHAVDRRVIGFCGLVHPDQQEVPEIKYALLREYWGQGLASELVPAMLAHGVSAHGMRRILATIAPANGASRRVLEKAGMRTVELRSEPDGSSTEVLEWWAPATWTEGVGE